MVYDRLGWWGHQYDTETLGSMMVLGKTLDDPGVLHLYEQMRDAYSRAREVDDELLIVGLEPLDGKPPVTREWLLGLSRDEYADVRDIVGDANRVMLDPWWVLKATIKDELKLSAEQAKKAISHIERVRTGRWERLLFRPGRQE